MILFKVSCHFLSSDGGLMFHVFLVVCLLLRLNMGIKSFGKAILNLKKACIVKFSLWRIMRFKGMALVHFVPQWALYNARLGVLWLSC